MRAFGSRSDSGTRATVMAAVSRPIGTFTRKIHSQPSPSVSTPPTSGPTATAKPVVAPQMPKAVPRSCGANSWAIRASEVANIIAPPMPWSPRATFSSRGRSGQPAEERGEDEEQQAGHENPPPAQQIGDRAGREQQRGERQRVRVDDPLQILEARAQVALDARQGDVHDRDVEQQHEDRQAHHQQRPPFRCHGSTVRNAVLTPSGRCSAAAPSSWPGSSESALGSTGAGSSSCS